VKNDGILEDAVLKAGSQRVKKEEENQGKFGSILKYSKKIQKFKETKDKFQI
jgi:hypothetical protein